MTTKKNIKTINALYNGLSTRDMPTVLELMHPEIVWTEAESNALVDGNYVGPNSILEGVFSPLDTNNEHFGLKDVEVNSVSDNKVLATLQYNGKVKATGKIYNAQAAHLWTLNSEGKITAFQQYVDTKIISRF